MEAICCGGTRLKKPLVILSTCLFTFAALFSLSHEAPHDSKPSTEPRINFDLSDTRRNVLDATNNSSSSLILAAERTHRRDPFDGFKYYKGGWNIRETHYYYSVGFTAIPLFIITATWFLGFGVSLLLIALCHCCSQKHSNYSRLAYWLSLTYVILFAIASIIGCAVLYVGQGKFHGQTTRTLSYVVQQADSVVDGLTNVSNSLNSAKKVGINQITLPQNVRSSIDSVEKKINDSSRELQQATRDNSDGIQQVFDSVRLSLITVSAVMLLLVFLGFLFSFLGKRRLVYTLVVIGWILVTGTFILAATFLLLHNVVGDTCVAMDEWVKNPTAKSTLDDILPCLDNSTAQQTLHETQNVTSQLVIVANLFITNISNVNVTTQLPIYYNQSGPPVPNLCDPFHSHFPETGSKCVGGGQVNFDNAQKEWKKFVCQVSESGICTTVGRLRPLDYNQLMGLSNMGSTLYNYGPFLVGVEDCTLVRETFRRIIREHCQGLNQNSRLIVIGLVLVSSSVMFSLIFWVLFARENNYNKFHEDYYDKQLKDESRNSI